MKGSFPIFLSVRKIGGGTWGGHMSKDLTLLQPEQLGFLVIYLYVYIHSQKSVKYREKIHNCTIKRVNHGMCGYLIVIRVT